jgi:chromosomal replication initiation ATPase DnaA
MKSGNLNKVQKTEIELGRIMTVVCTALNVTEMDFLSTRRADPLPHARAIATILAKDYTVASYKHIGRKFNKDHTTIMAHLKRIEKSPDPAFQIRLNTVRQWLEIA